MSQATLTPALSPSVSLVNGRPATTSLEVAKFFGKRHDNVVRDIESVASQVPENFLQLNFEESAYEQETPLGTKHARMFILHRDGFMLLVMGYTGKKAMQIKIAYIDAFNQMEAALLDNLAKQEQARVDEEVKPLSDAPLTPDQQCTLQAIVRAKVEAIPVAERGKGLYPQLWSRFNNHFRIAKYAQLPQSRMSEAVAYLTQLEVQQKALPSAAERTGIIPIRVNLAWTRDFAHAAAESGSAGSVAFNEGCVLAHKLAALAARVERAFAPRPDECRPVSYFDSIILSHRNAMKQSAELMRMAASVFADSCNALESLAKVVQQSDSGTALDTVRRHKIIMQDGTGVML